MIFFASCPMNQADLVAEEAREAKAENVRMTSSGVEFEGTFETGMRFCMESRASSRLLLGLFIDEDVRSTDELYDSTLALPWEEWVNPEMTIRVGCTTQESDWISNSHYASLKVKDAICDREKEKFGERSSVDVENPDITFHIHVYRNTVKWYVDFSGDSLYERGYRKENIEAEMKEHLAAALIMRSDWKKDMSMPLIDPFCGTGTIAIEAALMASETAPGLIRPRLYAFERLGIFSEESATKIWEEEEEKRNRALKERRIRIFASDVSEKAVRIAKKAAEKAGVSDLIEFSVRDFTSFTENDIPGERGCIITDPPYGERMDDYDIRDLYMKIGDTLQRVFKGWKCTILSGSPDMLMSIDMKPDRSNTLYNGPIQCRAAHYSIYTDEERQSLIEKAKKRKEERLAAPLSPGGEIIYKKIAKNLSEIKPIMEKEGVTSYRIYDAEIPEYPAAVDFYEGKWINAVEFAPGKDVDEEIVAKHREELLLAIERATGVDIESIFLKEKKRMRGNEQYTKLASSNRFSLIRENGLIYLVNFQDYHDVGVFLDHRPTRKLIEKMAQGKRFLNLFCYTGTATLNAIKGGALSTISVDTSSTYLDWAIENLKINGYPTDWENFFYKEDVMNYLWSTYDKFDLIFLDPPTFSDGKGRKRISIEFDHPKLISASAMHLSPGGTLIFSTNFRGFEMSEEVYEKFSVEDITEETIGMDFKADPNIHKCYLIKNKVKVHVPTKKLIKKKS